MRAAWLRGECKKAFCTLSPYDLKRGLIVFLNGRYLEILSSSPSTNKKLGSVYKVELLDLFTNTSSKEYMTYSQIERLDQVVSRKLDVEFQFFDDDKQSLILSDELYNQHEVPLYLYRGQVQTLQPGSRFTMFMDRDRYIRLI
jgi:translation elongation factor P/translation initiation factor 5A